MLVSAKSAMKAQWFADGTPTNSPINVGVKIPATNYLAKRNVTLVQDDSYSIFASLTASKMHSGS